MYSTSVFNRLLQASTLGLLALFLIALPQYTNIAKTAYALLVLGSLTYLLLNIRHLDKTEAPEKILLAIVGLSFVWTAIAFYSNNDRLASDDFLWGRHIYMACLIPLYYLFRRVHISSITLCWIVLGSIFLTFVSLILDWYSGADYRHRGMNPNSFGPILVVLGGALLFFFLRIRRSLKGIALLAGIIMALVSIILSESKTTWLTILVVIIFFSFYLGKSVSLAKKISITAVLLSVIASAYLLPVVKHRIDTGVDNMLSYFSSDDSQHSSRLGTFGSRMELWKTGWQIFRENPVTGIGVGGFQAVAEQNHARYGVNELVQDYKYVHNQYIAALATRGVPGLCFLLLTLWLPFYIAVVRKPGNEKEAQVDVERYLLILLCITYTVGNIFEDHFENKPAIMFISILLPLLLAKINRVPSAHNT